jgi:hypothetical protein
MTQKKSKMDGFTRETLADVAREMAKPRLAESVREAVEAAEAEEARVKRLRLSHRKREV